MSTKMTEAERDAFLAEPHVGILSISQKGRGPMAVPVWYDYAPGGEVWFLTQTSSRKGKLLFAGKRISLCAQRDSSPYAYVTVEGPISTIEPYTLEDDLLPMASRYLGAEGGAAYVEGARESHAKGSSVKVSFRPERWLTVDYAKAP